MAKSGVLSRRNGRDRERWYLAIVNIQSLSSTCTDGQPSLYDHFLENNINLQTDVYISNQYILLMSIKSSQIYQSSVGS